MESYGFKDQVRLYQVRHHSKFGKIKWVPYIIAKVIWYGKKMLGIEHKGYSIRINYDRNN